MVRALDQRAPSLSAALARADLRRGSAPSNIFSNAFPPSPSCWNASKPIRERAAATLDLFEHSPYFAEELIRTPELMR